MEGKHTQKSTINSKFFQIPIEEYEEDMMRESSKEKKKEILELFTTYNKIRSKDEFDEIGFDLHNACRTGDLELIKILLSETIEKSREGLTFKIDSTNETASLFNAYDDIEELIIPRTVEHNSTEYLITSIYRTGLNIKTIKFSEDSAVKTIYKNAFCDSRIEEVYFPENLRELKERWCYRTDNLKKIIISPSNDQFKFEDDRYLISKSDSNNDEFDTLLFVRRDIKKFSIPSNIKIISSYAFSRSNIETIFIPSKVTKICENAFYDCRNLTKVEIPTNSNLQTIGSNAFSGSKIEEIYFPASLRELKEEWCCETGNLKKIIISPSNDQFKFEDDRYLISKSDSNNDEFDTLLFVRRDIEKFSIPSNIKIISSDAFSRSNIETIFIPTKVTKICENAFYYCSNLTNVEIPTNSNLQIIESRAFKWSNIETIFIPSKVTKICEWVFYDCENLTKVEIPTNSNLQTIEPFAFSDSNIESIFIPSKVTKICEYAFYDCRNLTKVEIPTYSNLQIIEPFAFSDSKIESIFIPSKVTKICKHAFCDCENLQMIEISEESKLESISSTFNECERSIIMIPSSLRKSINTMVVPGQHLVRFFDRP
ncbi:hypothetical protein M9Y10_025185 [Tritrichomonas musculus]|uniref:Uncharacterized protein n=1 Tax=Tritrichomonas musculus TaxID=1915356 RepID=A0ABR2H9U3_9EUKA